jgi:hypothetical protein
MAQPSNREYSVAELAGWLFKSIEAHMPAGEIRSTLVARFGLPEDDAAVALNDARDGILRAISGSRKNMPGKISDPIANATFELAWSTFNQNSFFDRRRTPSRKWLDWKAQQADDISKHARSPALTSIPHSTARARHR